MEFKEGDRVHVLRFSNTDVDFYGTLKHVDESMANLFDCTNKKYDYTAVFLPSDDEFGENKTDYFVLAEDEEDTEEPVIQRINDKYNEVPTQYIVEVQGSYVDDIHLRGATKNGSYWAGYTPDNEKLDGRNVWITDDYRKALGVAYLVDGEVRRFKE